MWEFIRCQEVIRLANCSIDSVSRSAYTQDVTASELKRLLERAGCKITEGTKHWIVTYQGRQTTIPRHPSKEIKTGTYYGILKQLGINRK